MNLSAIADRIKRSLPRKPDGLANLPGRPQRFPMGDGLAFALRPPWEMTKELSETYGPISLAWLGPFPMVMLHDPEAIRRVLVQGDANGDVYKAEPIAAVRPLSPPNTSTFAQNGVEHDRARRMGFTSHPDYSAWLDETSVSLSKLAAERARGDLSKPGRGFDKRMFRFMFDAFSVAVLGKELGDAAHADAWTVFRNTSFRMRTNLPVVSPNFYRARNRWWDVFRQRVAEVKAGQASGGLVSHALPGARVSLEQFALTMSNVFPGGYFSVTSVILNALTQLDRHPELGKELRAAILADRASGIPLSRSRLLGIAPLERVVRETARVHTPVPLFMRRVGRAPLTIEGHELLPGTIIAIGPGPLHLSKEQWKDPERFDPSRWTPELMAERPYGSSWFFPFGRGGRECEGREMALTMIRAVLYGILSVGPVKIEGEGPVAQRFFHAVMMPAKLSGNVVAMA